MIFEECRDGDYDAHWVDVPVCQVCKRPLGDYPHNAYGRLDMEEGAQNWPDFDEVASYSETTRAEITRNYHAFVHPTAEQIFYEGIADDDGVRTQIRRNVCRTWRHTEEGDEQCDCPCHWGRYYVNAYAVDRMWGGPEEGGWWYDTGEPVESILFETWAAAEAYRDGEGARKWPTTRARYSVLGGEDHTLWIERHFAAPWPDSRPHYE